MVQIGDIDDDASAEHFNSIDRFNLLRVGDNNAYVDVLKDLNIDSPYVTEESFINNFVKNAMYVFSTNLCSLVAKFASLNNFLDIMTSNDINIGLICIQEVYQIEPEFFNIPGYFLFHNLRP